jgi:hypothetical protein
MKTEPKKINIQERMREKALDAYAEVEYQIDCWIDNKKSDFSMYKYLKQLEYSGKVVTFMSGLTKPALVEVKNEEGCEQLEEAFNFLTKTQKKNYIKFLEGIESDIEKYCNEYKPVRRVKPMTPARMVRKLPFLAEWERYTSIEPIEIPRAYDLFTYNTASKKFTHFQGNLAVKGSRITGYDSCKEKTLTDWELLDRIVQGGNIIARGFMDEIPRSKLKDGNDMMTKNTLLLKVIK